MKNRIQITLASTILLLMILNAKLVMQGALDGIALCYRSVIPSLFPFLVISNWLNGLLQSADSGSRLERYLKLPKASTSTLLLGLLGGFPIGAQMAAHRYENGSLTRSEASKLAGFCNNTGPAFLFGMAAFSFSDPYAGWLLWAVLILSAILTGLLTARCENGIAETNRQITIHRKPIIEASIKAICMICGWVILFRILIVSLETCFLSTFSPVIKILISGILEITNGCCSLANIENEGIRFILCVIFLCSGGLCVTMQTASIAKELNIFDYLRGKLLQTGIGILLALPIVAIIYKSINKADGIIILFTSIGLILCSRIKNSRFLQ